jgi:hypothetical protein
MKLFFFILMGFFPLLVSAQSDKSTIQIGVSSYSQNSLGEEYTIHTAEKMGDTVIAHSYTAQAYGDLRQIGQFITDSLTIQDVDWVHWPANFSLDLKNGVFVMHSKEEDSDTIKISAVYTDPNIVIRIEHPRSASIFYQFEWGECYWDDSHQSHPETTVRLVYRYGEFSLQAIDCIGRSVYAMGTSENAVLLWNIFSPIWER